MIYYALPTIILLFAAAFLMWLFIFGRKAVQKEVQKEDLASWTQKGVHILTAVFSILLSALIGYDIHKALSFLETFGDTEYLHALFYPVSALAVVFLLIPFAMVCAKREPVIPGVSAILSSLLVILLINLLCFCVIHEHDTISAPLCYLVSALLSCMVVYYTPRLSNDRYQAELKKIDGMLADARNAHYEAIKKSSMETRRSRHDLKNHLIAMKELAMQERKEELIAYIDNIAEQIEAAAPPYRSGNDIADVIIADKHAKAEKRGLELCISGDLAGVDIETADLVTILSNLLDNAIEAVSRLYGKDLPAEDKKIHLDFKKSANFLMILQKNKSMTKLVPGKIVSSKNSPDHGFGITNIKRAVKKYGGEYHLSCTEAEGLFLVETEIMLPLKD